MVPIIGIENINKKFLPILPIENVSERSNWILFNKADSIPMIGTSWYDHFITTDNPWVSETNKHPSLKTATEMAQRIINHIRLQFLDKN
jgi:hypothetical protein